MQNYPNLIVVKSISKSYGVPGLRLGILANADIDYINSLKKENAIWNINSFAEYYLQIYEKYNKTYSQACDTIANERNHFIKELAAIKNLKVYPSQANFVLCRLESANSTKLAVDLLEKFNIFIKDLNGKKCFDDGKYIRLAVRDKEDNDCLINALKKLLEK